MPPDVDPQLTRSTASLGRPRGVMLSKDAEAEHANAVTKARIESMVEETSTNLA
jgi:hypothetical protein